MTNYPKVFIVILNYNAKATVQKCLTSVFKLNYPNFEVVFVDNNSSDGSLELAKTNFSKADFIKNAENLGCAAGNNIGIRFSLERMAEYVLLLDSATEVDRDFLIRLIEVADRNAKIGLLSPIVFEGDAAEVCFSGGKINWFKMSLEYAKKIQTEDFYESEFLTNRGMLVKAEVFKKIGLFDEDFFLCWGDVDLSFRAGKAGFKNVMVSASWIYQLKKNSKCEENEAYWMVISGLVFFKKNIKTWMRPWIAGYIGAKKIGNWLDVKFNRNKTALVTRRAYEDFKNAKL
ncbi:MAG: glycosyltransferase family 2 protein [Parcubacteria group bacterium]